MIIGAHVLLYSEKPELDRAFFREVLELPFVDVGHGWLIFGLPGAELAVHPADDEAKQSHAGHRLMPTVLYLMCEDLSALMPVLKDRGVECTEVEEERWGVRTTVRLPSGGEVGLYQPKHDLALGLKKS
jgi:hypothetical protein